FWKVGTTLRIVLRMGAAIVRLGHRKVLMEGVCRAVQREPLLPTGLLPKINRRVAAYLNLGLQRRPRVDVF
ncbi:hypothetical protein C2E31_17045, partial [Rhodopirellula baltica]